MFPSASSRLVTIFLGCFLLPCGAQIQNQNLLYAKLDAEVKEVRLQCYDCNSEYDPRCGDPFNPYSIGMINCTDRDTPEHLRNPDNMHNVEPTLCRKMVQTVAWKGRVGALKHHRLNDSKTCFALAK